MQRRTSRIAMITALGLVMSLPARPGAQQAADAADHAAHHPAAPATQAAPSTPGPMASMTSAARLDELVRKMNSASGEAKTAAMAELLTALVQDRHACEPMMMKMMDMMGRANRTMPMKPPAR